MVFNSSAFKQQIAAAAAGYVSRRYGSTAGNYAQQAANYLFSSEGNKKRLTPAKALGGTKMRSYLDSRYQRKCGVEVKQIYAATATGTPTTTLATLVSPTVGIAQGLTNSTRIGDAIEIKKLRMRFTFIGGATSTANSTVRVIIVKQNEMSGAAATSSDILQTTTDIRSYYAQDKNESFTVLLDRKFEVTPVSTNDGKTRYTFEWNYRPKHCHSVQWVTGDTTGVIGNMIKGNINVKTMYESVGAIAPRIDFNSYLEYIDV